jgi:hypothetical protein
LVVEYINNNPEPGNNPAAVTLTVNSQEHQNNDDVEEEDVDPFSLLPLHQPCYHPVCDKLIILCGAIMAHQNNTVLPTQVVQGLMEEMREWRSNPIAPLNSVESHAHEIMSHNWNVGGQDILRLFPSVVGADGDQFLAIIKEAVTSLLDMSVGAAHALIEEVYFHHSFLTPSDVDQDQSDPPNPVDAFNMHWNSHVYIPNEFRARIINYTNATNFSGQFAAVYPYEQYLHQQIVTAEHPAISFFWISQSMNRLPCIICFLISCTLVSLNPARMQLTLQSR